MPAYACGQVRSGGLLVAKVLRQLWQVFAMHLGQPPTQPTGCRPGRSSPEAGWQGGLRRGGVREDAPCQQRSCGQMLPTGPGKDALPCCPEHLLGPSGACAPLRGRGVLSHKGLAQRGL